MQAELVRKSDVPTEILPTSGFVFHDVEEHTELLCPPKLLPIKSFTLERLERLENRLCDEAKAKRAAERRQKATPISNTDALDLKKTATNAPCA